MFKIGDKVIITDPNEYYDDFRGKILIVTSVARSSREHSGYDGSMNRMPLYSFKFEDGTRMPYSLYENEIKEYKGE